MDGLTYGNINEITNIINMSEKIRTICIDTVTQIQEHEYMLDKKKPGHDKWKDYSTTLYAFMVQLQELGFELILIIGPPGTGKSSGMRHLPHNTNMWFNADNKNPVWEGGKEEYQGGNNLCRKYKPGGNERLCGYHRGKDGINTQFRNRRKYHFHTC